MWTEGWKERLWLDKVTEADVLYSKMTFNSSTFFLVVVPSLLGHPCCVLKDRTWCCIINTLPVWSNPHWFQSHFHQPSSYPVCVLIDSFSLPSPLWVTAWSLQMMLKTKKIKAWRQLRSICSRSVFRVISLTSLTRPRDTTHCSTLIVKLLIEIGF